MKKCPICERTFDDNMRFCQSDGTPLVDEAPAVDPYKTMVASAAEIAASLPSSSGDAPVEETAAGKDEEVLQLPPETDPKKTMYTSEEEIRKEMAAHDEPVMDLPPLAPEPPKFSEPSLSPPSFGSVSSSAPPPSPYSSSENEPIANPSVDSPFNKTTPPIPSPFDNPKPSAYEAPAAPNFVPESKPESTFGQPAATPFEPAAPIEVSTPSTAQYQEPNEPMQNPAFSPTPAAAGQNKTLAIVSLVAGILGLTLCCGTLLPSLIGIVLGFMAKGKASNDPVNFGGSGLALGGIITGVLGLLIGIGYLIFVFFLGGMQIIMQGMQ